MRWIFSISLAGYSFSFSFYTGKAINFNFLIAKKPEKETIGITSRCVDGKHVLFFDYDGLTFDEMLDELIFIQIRNKLSEIYLFELDRENSFHAICLDKFRLYDAIEIISDSSADYGFKKAPLRYRRKRWVLRISGKGERERPQYIGEIASNEQIYEKSSAHKRFLCENYNLRLKNLKNEDGLKDSSDFCNYLTSANIKKDVKQ